MKIGNGIKNNRPYHAHENMTWFSGFIRDTLIIVFVLFFILSCSNEKSGSKLYTFAGGTMGTTYSIKIVWDNSSESNIIFDSLDEKIDSILIEVNRQMSTYIPTSEISQFNNYKKTNWFPVSEDFAFVLSQGLMIGKESNGAYDLTIGPLVNLWGFGPENVPNKIPTDEEIREGLNNIGLVKVFVDTKKGRIRKDNIDMYCDLSGIAKGFGVDKIADYFDSLTIDNYMVEIGGEVRTKGKNLNNKYWQIGISTADERENIEKIVPLNNMSMATSGDYRNYFEDKGIRYSHTIDPRTGRPITHKLASVTVIHSSCMLADGLATAINVMGPDEGFDFALTKGIPVIMIIREGNEFVEKYTPSFKEYLNNGG